MSQHGLRTAITVVSNSIKVVRGRRVILDNDLAKIYGVTTKALNQAIKRNRKKFPEDFVFRLSSSETDFLMSQSLPPRSGVSNRSQIVTGSQKHRDRRFH